MQSSVKRVEGTIKPKKTQVCCYVFLLFVPWDLWQGKNNLGKDWKMRRRKSVNTGHPNSCWHARNLLKPWEVKSKADGLRATFFYLKSLLSQQPAGTQSEWWAWETVQLVQRLVQFPYPGLQRLLLPLEQNLDKTSKVLPFWSMSWRKPCAKGWQGDGESALYSHLPCV